ncbi:hypothetical protein CYY_007009 [Polysphondylium violaceum]|uniref:EGF-like domain-containing protein n=1 Tax=Polysphondylium violaceum TaxID=133409 RepID=A0A8J4PRE6_9MYCE|nr:hypothetical protein CYY_007009 [Polysphondylium violaceum]
MERNRLFILSLFILISVLYVSGAPVITKVSPSWGPLATNIFLDGTGFGATAALNLVTGSTFPCAIESATSTRIRCFITDQSIPVPSTLQISVTTGGVTSNKVNYGLMILSQLYQTNERYNFVGKFGGIEKRTQITATAGSETISVVYENDQSMYFILTAKFMKVPGPNFELRDSSTGESVINIPCIFAAVVRDVKFYESTIVFTGYIFQTDTAVTAGEICPVLSVSETLLTCSPVSKFFFGVGKTTLPYTLMQANGLATTLISSIIALASYENTGTDASVLKVSTGNIGKPNIRVTGLTPTPITPIATTPAGQVTSVTFTYPPNSLCGNVFVSDASASFQRLTSSIFMCPTPLISKIVTKPNSSNSYRLTFTGMFLGNQKYNIADGVQTIAYKIQYGGGSVQICTFVSQALDPNSIYTIVCGIPTIASPASFRLTATTLEGQSSSILVGYQPTITSITKTDYKVPGVVTIIGTAFTSLDLLVTIGGSECQNPVVQGDGLQMTCTFGSDVPVVDFSKPLEVVVSIGSTYIDKKSLFYYKRPTPTISSSTRVVYGVPGAVTVTGTYLYSTNLVVTIGGSPCTSPLSAQDGNSITCQFQSVQVSDITLPLEVSLTIDSIYTVKKSVFYYTLTTPTIVDSTSTVYETAGSVTITGTSFYNFGLVVSIGGATCSTPIASQDNKQITCQFSSGVTTTDIKNPIEISVTINTVTVKKSIFYYTLKPATIASSTSLMYGVQGTVTIIGTSFYNFGLVVSIGGAACSTPVASQDNKQITCQFSSGVTTTDIKNPLEISVTINSVSVKNSVFYYTLPTPTIISSTPLEYGKAGTVIITGTAFYGNFGVVVLIGNSPCSTPLASEDKTQITCQFSGVTVTDINKPLEVSVTVASTYNANNSVFYYTLPIVTITSSTSLVYGTTGLVTITGTNFYNFGLVVTIGAATCNNAIPSPGSTQITCEFQSGVITDISAPLEIIVTINSVAVKKSVFYYTLTTPTITNSTSTVYETAGLVTITGTSFYDFGLVVTIGGAACSTPVVSQDNKQITCHFTSSVAISDIKRPLEVSVTIDHAKYSAKNNVFYFTLQNPTIASSTQTIYGKPGIITITGSAFYNFDLVVEIGSSPCRSAVASQDNKHITCRFESDVAVPEISVPLEVLVSIDTNYVTKEKVFYYAEPTHVLITSSTSTTYGVPGIVTLTGTNFIGQDLIVTIGNSPCSSPVTSQDKTLLTCYFKSDVKVLDIQSPLDVFVSVEPDYNATSSVFYYTLPLPTILSSTSTFYGLPATITITGTSFFNFDLIVNIGGSSRYVSVLINTDYKVKKAIFYYTKPIQVSISSSSSTKYGVPGVVTITGNNFINDQLLVKIGGSECTDALASSDSKQLTCNFKSDIQVSNFNTLLDVFVSIKSLFNATKPVFLYIKSDKSCPAGSNGQVCSGHGTCNQQFTCDCNKGWESSDCSIPNNGGGTVIPDPNVNPNDTSSTINTPGGTKFDVGITLIQEIDKNNNVLQSYNITSIKWNNITKQDNQHIYTTTLQNNQSTLNVKLSINNLDENVYFNFAGDVIPILPKSIKYQVELQNYTFSSSLNTMQFIFKSGIIQQGGECVYESDTNTQPTSGYSIRSILVMLNGETLVGTFSDRIVLDDRPSYNQVNKLTDTQINQYNLNSQSIYVAITTTSFKSDIVVDPNFGVLITNKPDNENKCKKKFAPWKIAVIVVCSVAAVGLVVVTVMLMKKKAVTRAFNAKLKKLHKK